MLGQWLKEANHTVILTGAGMSTESGLPDFRSADTGLWQNMDPSKLASTTAMTHHREDFISFYKWRLQSQMASNPHPGHHILAKWEQNSLIQSIITQNVDGLHQQAGNEQVSELHGTLRHLHCERCGKKHPIASYTQDQFTCDCGGFLRPSIVLFGEMLPADAIMFAKQETAQADLFIVLGSSLQVAPASYFPLEAKSNGAKLVIINEESTPMDERADLVINHRKIGEVLREVDQEVL